MQCLPTSSSSAESSVSVSPLMQGTFLQWIQCVSVPCITHYQILVNNLHLFAMRRDTEHSANNPFSDENISRVNIC